MITVAATTEAATINAGGEGTVVSIPSKKAMKTADRVARVFASNISKLKSDSDSSEVNREIHRPAGDRSEDRPAAPPLPVLLGSSVSGNIFVNIREIGPWQRESEAPDWTVWKRDPDRDAQIVPTDTGGPA